MHISSRTRLLIIAGLLVVTGWNLYANHKQQEDLNILDRTVLFVTAPAQKAITWCIDGAGQLLSGYVALVGVQRDNEQLRDQVASWQSMEARVRELELQNDRLRALAALRQRIAVPSVGGQVIGWGTSSRFRVVRIDRGRAHGLAPGVGVVCDQGVVGQVLHTSAGAADVLLMSDGSSNLAARLQESRLRGIVQGNGRWGASLEFVNRQDADAVHEGDLVVTSGDSQVFPPGIPIGRVASVEVANTGQFLTVTLTPAAELSNLEEVLALLEPGAVFGEPRPFLPQAPRGAGDPPAAGEPADGEPAGDPADGEGG